VVDRLCDRVAERLTPDGVLLLVQSEVYGAEQTGATPGPGRYARGGPPTGTGAVRAGHAGPSDDAGITGLIEPGADREELVIVQARRVS
jgi:hypothetical protein